MKNTDLNCTIMTFPQLMIISVTTAADAVNP